MTRQMAPRPPARKIRSACLFIILGFVLFGSKFAEAATYYWVSWTSYAVIGGVHTVTGTITTATDTVTVTYTNTQGLAGVQLQDGTGGNTNYYSGGTDGAAGTSPYTSATVENRPDNVTIVRLSNAGTQTLTFNKNISGLALAFVSLNGNAFSFDRNFDILSFGDNTDGGNACGFWGCGTATKTIGGGAYPYVVSGTGEPHGTLNFTGSFAALTWTSGNENWHGFTVGVAGTSAEVGGDTTPPTVTIDPADGTTNVPLASNITITFNEEVRNLDDTPLTNANVDALITLKDGSSSGADIPFNATIDVANKVITIDPTGDFSLDQVIYIAIGATVEDTFGNAITAANATITTGASLPSNGSNRHTDPRNKEDVVGNIQAWSATAERWARVNLNSMSYRLDWLRRNQDPSQRTHMGMNFGDAGSGGGDIGPALANTVLSKTAQAAQNAVFGSGGQTGDAAAEDPPWWRSILGEWSLWTQGDVAIGKTRATDNTPEESIQDSFAFIGIDRPIRGADGLAGLVFGYGKSDTEVGRSGSGVTSDNYGISGYTAFKVLGSPVLELTLGYGRMDMDITRIDVGQTLIGSRDGDQIFGSVELQSEPFFWGELAVSPYGRFEAAHASLDAFTETGGDMALIFARQDLDRTMVFFGTDVDYEMKLDRADLRPFGKVEYGLNVSYESDVDMRYVADPTNYRFALNERSSSLWRAGLGFDLRVHSGIFVSLAYFRTQTLHSDYLDDIELKISTPF